MVDFSNLQHPRLLESPGRKLFRKIPIDSLFRLSVDSLDTSVEPNILQYLERPKHRETCRISSLHCSDQGQLPSSRKRIFNAFAFFLRVVAICCRGSSKNRRKKRTVIPKRLPNGSRHSNDSIPAKVVLSVRSQRFRPWEKEDVVLLSCCGYIMIEVVNNNGGPVWG